VQTRLSIPTPAWKDITMKPCTPALRGLGQATLSTAALAGQHQIC
jgi:hypothetical protein